MAVESRRLPAGAAAAARPWQPWAMLGVLLAAQLAVAYAARAVGPLAPFLEAEFGLSKAQVGMLQSALFLGQVLGGIPSGALTDRLGVRPMLVLSPAGVVLALAGLVVSRSWPWTLAALVLAGTSYAAMHAITNKGILAWFAPDRRGTAVGIKQTGITSGAALAAAIVPALAGRLGWRTAVAVNAGALAAVGALATWLWRQPEPPAGSRPGGSPPAPGGHGAPAPTPAALVGAHPLVRLLANPRLWRLSLLIIPLTAVQFSVSTYLLLFARDAFGYSVAAAGAFLAAAELAGSAGRILWGVLSDRLWYARRQPALAAIAATGALAAAGAALLPGGAPAAALGLVAVALGLSAAGFNGIWMNLASELVAPDLAGLASGLSLAIGSLGAVLGPPLFGLTVDRVGSYRAAWWLSAALLAAVWAALRTVRLEQGRGA